MVSFARCLAAFISILLVPLVLLLDADEPQDADRAQQIELKPKQQQSQSAVQSWSLAQQRISRSRVILDTSDATPCRRFLWLRALLSIVAVTCGAVAYLGFPDFGGLTIASLSFATHSAMNARRLASVSSPIDEVSSGRIGAEIQDATSTQKVQAVSRAEETMTAGGEEKSKRKFFITSLSAELRQGAFSRLP